MPYPTKTEKPRTIDVQRFKVDVVGVEDLIIDRLVAAKYSRSNAKLDTEQATVLLSMFKKSVDIAYLKRRYSEEKVSDYLIKIAKFGTK